MMMMMMMTTRPNHTSNTNTCPNHYLYPKPICTANCLSRIIRLLFIILMIILIHLTYMTNQNHQDSNSSSRRWGGIPTMVVHGKEIVAQRDVWTLIGENDTVDAGMHIRIDMTTGEKWVKQIVNENENENINENKSPEEKNIELKSSSSLWTSSSSSTAVVVTESNEGSSDAITSTSNEQEPPPQQSGQTELNVNGEIIPTTNMTLPKQIIHNDDSDNSSTSKQQSHSSMDQPKYDYDMMYRTLKKLPIEEQIRMQLPMEYVTKDDETRTNTFNVTTTNKHEQQRQQFETKLRYIWEQRQQELLELEIADLPLILKEYIHNLQTYITQQQQSQIIRNDPMDLTSSTNESSTMDRKTNDETTTNATNGIIVSHPHMISILQELEYQLQDIDLTRDFHTLHGWHHLVSLLSLPLSPQSIWSNSPNDTTTTTTTTNSSTNIDSNIQMYQQQQQQHEIQMYAAWVIGTALKHIPEFHTYAIEPIQYVVPSNTNTSTTTTTTTTTLDLVLQQIQLSYEEYDSFIRMKRRSIIQTDDDEYDTISKLLQTKLLRFIYCLGSLLRGNYYAQQHVLLLSNNESSTIEEHEKGITRLQEFMNRVLFPSLQQLHHHEFIRSFVNNNNSSNSSNGDNDTTTTSSNNVEKQHIDFLYKFTQRSLNILLDCLDEIKSNVVVNDNDVNNPKWNLQQTNPTQYQQLQHIYPQWHDVLCNATSSTTHTMTSATSTTTEERILQQHQHHYHSNNSSSIIDFNSFISTPFTSTDPREEMVELQSTIRSILDQCPNKK